MKVRWIPAARKHLKSIHDYVAADSTTYARRLIDRITKRTEQLAAFPESGVMVPEFGDPAIRELLERPYRIIYRMMKDRVDVIAVIHSTCELPSDVR